MFFRFFFENARGHQGNADWPKKLGSRTSFLNDDVSAKVGVYEVATDWTTLTSRHEALQGYCGEAVSGRFSVGKIAGFSPNQVIQSEAGSIPVGQCEDHRENQRAREEIEPNRVRIVEPEINHHDQREDEQPAIDQQEVAPQIALVFQILETADGAMVVQGNPAPE
jgi:hypothetical protein